MSPAMYNKLTWVQGQESATLMRSELRGCQHLVCSRRWDSPGLPIQDLQRDSARGQCRAWAHKHVC